MRSHPTSRALTLTRVRALLVREPGPDLGELLVAEGAAATEVDERASWPSTERAVHTHGVEGLLKDRKLLIVKSLEEQL
jgi:hypothetical protein